MRQECGLKEGLYAPTGLHTELGSGHKAPHKVAIAPPGAAPESERPVIGLASDFEQT